MATAPPEIIRYVEQELRILRDDLMSLLLHGYGRIEIKVHDFQITDCDVTKRRRKPLKTCINR